MKRLMITVVALAGALIGVSANAETAYFVVTNSAALSPWSDSSKRVLWGTCANWVTSSGTAPTVAPTNGEDIVFGDLQKADAKGNNLNIGSQRVITWQYGSSTVGVNPIVGSVTGPRRYVITHASRQANENSIANPRRFTIGNPNGFDGIWQTAGIQGYFTLPNDGSRLGCLNVLGHPFVEAPTAGTTVKIGELSGGGVLDKMGPGALEIECPMGGIDTSIYVREGDLTLHGENEGDLAAILAKAYVQLDASVASSFVTSNDTTAGWTRVMKWSDPRAGHTDVYAYGSHFTSGGSPTYFNQEYDPAVMAKEKSPTKLNLVSFGASPTKGTAADVAAYGPMRSILQFNKDVTNIREIFFAAQLVKGWTYNAGLFGHHAEANTAWNLDDHIFGSTAENATYHPCDTIYGEWRFNGARTAREDISMSGRTNLFVAADTFDRGVIMSRLGNTRNYNYYTGNSYLGEILIFTNALTRTERILLDNHLNAKWRTGANVHLGTVFVGANGSAITVPEGETVRLARLVADGGTIVKRGAGILEVGVLVTMGTGKLVIEGGRCDIKTKLDEPTTDAPADGAYFWMDAEKTSKMDTTWKSNHSGWESLTFVTNVMDCRDGVTICARSNSDQRNTSSPDTGIARFPTL